MSQDKQYAQRFQDLININNVNVSSQEVNQQNNNQMNNSLALENMNSLALFPRPSIEKIIPLTKNMLSEDMYMKQSDSSEQQVIKQEKPLKSIILQNQQEWLVDQLDLPKTIKKRKFQQNTKNVLRNFGNAQNQYALYNKQANKIVNDELKNPEDFFKWVRQLRLQNFQGFKNVWMNTQNHNKAFVRVYKKICWQFYVQTAIPYVLTSRMRDSKTKVSHLKYLYRFLEGLKDPENFNYFKKVQK